MAGLVLAWQGPGDVHERVIEPDAFKSRRGTKRRIFSWGEIGADEMNLVRANVPLGMRGNATRRAGRMNIRRLIARLRQNGLDEATIQRILTGVDQ